MSTSIKLDSSPFDHACGPEGSRSLLLDPEEWQARRQRHVARLGALVEAHRERASRGVRHPVMDFLFQYYPFSPGNLLRWTPGWGVVLKGAVPDDLRAVKESIMTEAGWMLDAKTFPRHRLPALAGIAHLLKQMQDRPPRFGCFGLHEWAMVYRRGQDQVRHADLPLRLSPETIAQFVESQSLCCSHYDAFRFFTPEARPLNRWQPELQTRPQMEQRGCLHANMDLYKWASQFYPWVDSDLMADSFLLACRIREVDMRASPYDVQGLGLDPISIETEQGRALYVDYQRQFVEAADPLRTRLMAAMDKLLAEM